MKEVKINKEGFVESPYTLDADIIKEIDDDTYEMLMSCRIGMNWRLIGDEFRMVDVLDADIIRQRRQSECFNVIDIKSQLWWNHLAEEKKQELNKWYEAWLNATETKVIPVKPEWLE